MPVRALRGARAARSGVAPPAGGGVSRAGTACGRPTGGPVSWLSGIVRLWAGRPGRRLRSSVGPGHGWDLGDAQPVSRGLSLLLESWSGLAGRRPGEPLDRGLRARPTRRLHRLSAQAGGGPRRASRRACPGWPATHRAQLPNRSSRLAATVDRRRRVARQRAGRRMGAQAWWWPTLPGGDPNRPGFADMSRRSWARGGQAGSTRGMQARSRLEGPPSRQTLGL